MALKFVTPTNNSKKVGKIDGKIGVVLRSRNPLSDGKFILNYSEIPIMGAYDEKEVIAIGSVHCDMFLMPFFALKEPMFGDNGYSYSQESIGMFKRVRSLLHETT